MNTRRSLFVTGALLSVLVFFGSATHAQAQVVVTDPTMVRVTSERHTTFIVEWEYSAADESAALKEFKVRYQEGVSTACATDLEGNNCDFDTGSTAKAIKSKTVRPNTDDDDDYETTITGLTPGKEYLVGVTGVPKLSANTASDEVKGAGVTDGANVPDDVDGLDLEAGDSVILATWEEATDNGSNVTGYQVQYMMEDDDDWKDSRLGSAKDTSTMWTISNLENGMEYSVRVRAYSYTATSDDIWSDTEMAMPMAGAGTPGGTTPPKPTPALPLFGAFALGAGVLAAGRARLRRRREQRQLPR